MTATCYHCGQPVPPGFDRTVAILGQSRSMCCEGCAAVARAIVDNGLESFYAHRDAPAANPQDRIPAVLRDVELYDRPAVQRGFVRAAGEGGREAALILEGLQCAACAWLNEQHVRGLPGVLSFQVNYTTHRARVRWDPERIALSDVIRAIAAIGYAAHPYNAERSEAVFRRERSAALKRLAVAAFGMMQVMILAVALYAGEHQGMSEATTGFLRWMSLLFATPVVLYAAQPFFAGAWRDLRRRHAGMDVPIALALGSTFLASAWATFTQSGAVYFESATMFVFFLLLGRFLELEGRRKAGAALEAIDRLQPAMALRTREHAPDEWVETAALEPGDTVRVRPGDACPADGVVVDAAASVDEALLTGEGRPVTRLAGESVVAGAVNRGAPFRMRVERLGADGTLGWIQSLLERGQGEKPAIARLAERGTGWFVLAVLLLTATVGGIWTAIQPADAFWVMLAMLVISCPCALALATPVALTASIGALTRQGVLISRGHALETLAAADHVVLDKTGSLTEGAPVLESVVTDGLGRDSAVRIAAALEQGSEHPLAHAFRGAPETGAAQRIETVPGRGIEGTVDGVRYRLGREDYVGAWAPGAELPAGDPAPDATIIHLRGANGTGATFHVRDPLRAGAEAFVERLRRRGCAVTLLSGDSERAVRHVAGRLGIADWAANLTPVDKLERLQALQASGATVAVVGDGINDAPALGAAHVGVAMASGPAVTRSSADIIFTGQDLAVLGATVDRARQTLRIIRQNIGWAIGYNALALPVAALGWVSPWLAALGMSVSSLVVVLNALRLAGDERDGLAGAPTRRDPVPAGTIAEVEHG